MTRPLPSLFAVVPAGRAWHLLNDEVGVGWVIVGKLFAHKRPRLIPVYDNVVRCAIGKPEAGSVWTSLDQLLQDPEIVGRLDRLDGLAGLPAEVSPLWVLDVVLWMRHRGDHRLRGCGGLR